jgi:hypothetical protein
MFSIEKKQKGFTLLEAIIYIALFAFVIGSGVISTYQIFDGQANIKTKARQEMEIDFVFHKLQWAMSESQIYEPDTLGEIHPYLQTIRDGRCYTFYVDESGVISLKSDLKCPLPSHFHPYFTDGYTLTSSRLHIENLSVKKSAENPDVIKITMIINKKVVGPITYYARTN